MRAAFSVAVVRFEHDGSPAPCWGRRSLKSAPAPAGTDRSPAAPAHGTAYQLSSGEVQLPSCSKQNWHRLAREGRASLIDLFAQPFRRLLGCWRRLSQCAHQSISLRLAVKYSHQND